jgi:acyl-CoA dehydrogenase
MKDFLLKGLQFNREEKMILETVRDLCRKEIGPRAAEIDENERFPWENIQKLNEVGLNGLFIPEAYGGSPVSKVAWMTLLKEISKTCPSTAIIYATTSHCCCPIIRYGSVEQKEKFLSMVIGGSLGAISVTESDAGSDARAMKAQAEKTPDGYTLNGVKQFVTTGDVADITIVFANILEKGENQGMSPFIVTRDIPGFSVGKKEKKMGIRGSSTTEILLEKCRVPVDRLLGKPGDGFKIFLDFLNDSRPNIAAQAVGVAQAAFDAAVSHANQRIQFGRRIIELQGIQFMIADMATRIMAAWQSVLNVARLMDQGADDFSVEASMAKLLASEVAERVASDAVQIHGGYGYCRDYPVERIFRDSKITQIYEGTSQIQKILIGRHFVEKLK